jgi:hypothetical protein
LDFRISHQPDYERPKESKTPKKRFRKLNPVAEFSPFDDSNLKRYKAEDRDFIIFVEQCGRNHLINTAYDLVKDRKTRESILGKYQKEIQDLKQTLLEYQKELDIYKTFYEESLTSSSSSSSSSSSNSEKELTNQVLKLQEALEKANEELIISNNKLKIETKKREEYQQKYRKLKRKFAKFARRDDPDAAVDENELNVNDEEIKEEVVQILKSSIKKFSKEKSDTIKLLNDMITEILHHTTDQETRLFDFACLERERLKEFFNSGNLCYLSDYKKISLRSLNSIRQLQQEDYELLGN